MGNFDFHAMQGIQQALQDKYKDKWGGLSPEKGREKLLWMMIEAGEMADIIKKEGDGRIVNDPPVRQHFVEEICDVMMYLNDVMLCYQVTPEELETVYRAKHQINMTRW